MNRIHTVACGSAVGNRPFHDFHDLVRSGLAVVRHSFPACSAVIWIRLVIRFVLLSVEVKASLFYGCVTGPAPAGDVTIPRTFTREIEFQSRNPEFTIVWGNRRNRFNLENRSLPLSFPAAGKSPGHVSFRQLQRLVLLINKFQLYRSLSLSELGPEISCMTHLGDQFLLQNGEKN